MQLLHSLEDHDDIYFLFSNIAIFHEGKEYNSLAIKLYNGIMLTFDGSCLCHGTTMSSYLFNYCGFVTTGNAMISSATLSK